MAIRPRRPAAGRTSTPLRRAWRPTASALLRRVLLGATLTLGVSGGVASSGAQETPAPLQSGTIVGLVTNEGGLPVAGAQVQVVGLLARGVTGAEGTFSVVGVPVGEQRLVVRRIGFRPESTTVAVQPGGESRAEVRLVAVSQRLDAVVVEARKGRPVYSGRMGRFWERHDRGVGRFFTAEDIDRRRPQLVSDLLRMLPGIRFARRGAEQVILFRGEDCPPTVYLDGMAATAGFLNPDHFAPNTLAGIEVYSGPAQVPPELMLGSDRGACGVIALWTRLDEPRGRQRASPVTAEDLAALVQSLSLYTADQVDVPAQPDPATPLSPIYPDSLLRAGVSGQVLVELVVDTTGAPDMSTFGVVLSTDPLFTRAVRRTVVETHFSPAQLNGRAVRQLVQLPFRFVAPAPDGARP